MTTISAALGPHLARALAWAGAAFLLVALVLAVAGQAVAAGWLGFLGVASFLVAWSWSRRQAADASAGAPVAAAATPAAPGWYPYPGMVGTQRYWDGSTWTDHTAPLARPRNEADGLVGVGIVTALLFPIVGFIISIVLLARGNNKWGIRVLLGSIGAALFWYYQLRPDPAPTTIYYPSY